MSNENSFRSIFVTLPFDKRFQRMSERAKAIFYTLKLSPEHERYGLWRWVPEAFCSRHFPDARDETGFIKYHAMQEFLEGVDELRYHGWIELEGDYIRVCNALKFELMLSIKLNVSSHKTALSKFVEKHRHLNMTRTMLEEAGILAEFEHLLETPPRSLEEVSKDSTRSLEEVSKDSTRSLEDFTQRQNTEDRDFPADAAGEDVEEEEVVASATNSSQEDERWSQLDEEWAEWDREHPQGEESSQEEEDECKPVTTISLPEATSFEEYKRNKIIQAMSDTSEEPQFQDDDSWMEDEPEPQTVAVAPKPVPKLSARPAWYDEVENVTEEEADKLDDKPSEIYEESELFELANKLLDTHCQLLRDFFNPTDAEYTRKRYPAMAGEEFRHECLMTIALELRTAQRDPANFMVYCFETHTGFNNSNIKNAVKQGKKIDLSRRSGIGFPSINYICKEHRRLLDSYLALPRGYNPIYFTVEEEVANA